MPNTETQGDHSTIENDTTVSSSMNEQIECEVPKLKSANPADFALWKRLIKSTDAN